jgi:hypothetical protein
MKKYFVSAAIAIALAIVGPAAHADGGTQVLESQVSDFKTGITTLTDVKGRLGRVHTI